MAMSLPYGLKILRPDNKTVMTMSGIVENMHIIFSEKNDITYGSVNSNRNKPILNPLSDLIKEIEHKGEKFVPLYKLFQPPIDKEDCAFTNERKSYRLYAPIGHDVLKYDVNKDCNVNTFWVVQKLAEWHIDFAGLIEKGDAIDVNTLEINPYK